MTGDTSHAAPATSTLGIAFAEAFAAKDYDRFRAHRLTSYELGNGSTAAASWLRELMPSLA